MKIISLRFKNLNSLTGEWFIDFTHPQFESGSIFAITGPTGAGKTTILDAMCLALYGRTPRLGKITKSSNEIMSRRTGDCSAEIIFETVAGRFRAHWAQHRSRKKHSGELQEPRHELADERAGKILETYRSKTEPEVERVTGMSFGQFTRAVMLAQGAFAAFLEAPPDDRAGLLEQITGTEIYSRISMRVHLRRGKEQEKLRLLDNELASAPGFSESDEKTLTAERQAMAAEVAALDKELAGADGEVARLKRLSDLEKRAAEMEAERAALSERAEKFAPHLARLAADSRACLLGGDYGRLKTLRQKRGQAAGELARLTQDLPAAAQAAAEKMALAHQAAQRLAQARQAEAFERPAINQAREYDVKIGEIAARLKPMVQEVERLTAEAAVREAALARAGEKLKAADQESAQLHETLTAAPAEAALATELSAIEQRLKATFAANSRLADKAAAVAEAEKKLNRAHNELSELTGRAEGLSKTASAHQAAHQGRVEELEKILEGHDLSAWHLQMRHCERSAAGLEKALRVLSDLAAAEKELAAQKQAKAAAEMSLNDIKSALDLEEDFLKTLVGEFESLEVLRQLNIRVRSLEEDRGLLSPGRPCPLCGSLDHPWADPLSIPPLGEAEAKIQANRAAHQKHDQAAAQLRQKSAALEQAIKSAEAQGRKLEELAAALANDPAKAEAGDGSIEELTARKKREEEQASAIEKRLAQAAVLEAAVKKSATELAAHQKSLEGLDEKIREAQTAANQAQDDLKRHQAEIQNACLDLEKTLADSRGAIAPYGWGDFKPEEIEAVFLDLKTRRDKRVAAEDRATTLARLGRDLAHEIEGAKCLIDKDRQAAEKIKAESALLMAEQTRLWAARRALLGDDVPADRERLLAEAIAKAEGALKEAEDQKNQRGGEWEKLKAAQGAAEKNLAQLQAETQTAEESFIQNLKGHDFTSEDDFQAALLPPHLKAELSAEEKSLSEARAVNSARLAENNAALETEKKQAPSEAITLEQALAQAARVAEARDNLRGRLGAIDEKIREYRQAQKLNRELMERRAAQKSECLRWDSLHELIGSADGKKYRNFAQGLTFEIMVREANRWLSGLSDRYLLIRSAREPLELNVTDNYQAGETRSTKNLSGGERFIVSLALALALSKMSGRGNQAHSLFLDEGFGTLDEDSLDTALEALASLREHGGLVGIISHIQTLTDRIPITIKVTPTPTGQSTLKGQCVECVDRRGLI